MTIARPSTVWAIFAVCIAVLLAAMAWVSAHTLRLEAATLRDSEFQERVRLALWRMDSAAGALITAENARPANHFQDFHAADQAYTNTFQILRKGAVILPSPLLNDAPKHTRLYCQIGNDWTFTSPQVPAGNNRDLAEQNYVSREEIDSAAALLEKARVLFPDQAIAPGVPRALRPPVPDVKEAARQQASQSQQQIKNSGEFLSRNQSKDNTYAWTGKAKQAKLRPSQEIVRQQAESAGVNVADEDTEEAFEGIWKAGELFLVRKAKLAGREVTQGIWLDADLIREMLLNEARDLLPNASLAPVTDAPQPDAWSVKALESRALYLVSLPFRLEPGEVAIETAAVWSPMRRSLALAWACAVLAAVAVGGLLYGIIGLSERRAAFVSAVTHEMRTPLTTFRLYSEMLAGDMVTDPDKRREYLSTLTSEADRLSHLVENVLAYAQLEKGSARAQVEEASLQSIIDRVLPRLEQRAGQSDMRMQVDVDVDAHSGAARIKVDLTAVEQILFNLVDNACKYASPETEEERVIHLEADTDGPMALLRVRDHGRGISKLEERRLFRPFQKSADEAAHSAPGVGLGLALCRKLTRVLGGELRLCRKGQGGCFVLAFPAVTEIHGDARP